MIRKRIKELIESETVKSKGLIILKREFNISAAKASELWLEVKEEMSKEKAKVNEVEKQPKKKPVTKEVIVVKKLMELEAVMQRMNNL